LPRLCVYERDRTQYYPCVLNYIGLNSWSLYRCPHRSTFDEQTQQCLTKIPVSDTFEQLATYLASFIRTSSVGHDESSTQQRRLISLPPMIDKLIDRLSMKQVRHKTMSRSAQR
jgi:hypothetical protein